MSKSIPTNLKLYNQVKSEVKLKFKKWPSAYASGFLVQEYKKRGGTYKSQSKSKSKSKKRSRSKINPLSRWYQEQWIDVCHLPNIVPCGRETTGKDNPNNRNNRDYPYCRPLKKINKNTPQTALSLSKSQRKRLCSKKRKQPSKRVWINKSRSLRKKKTV
jgi:hypothetical protein